MSISTKVGTDDPKKATTAPSSADTSGCNESLATTTTTKKVQEEEMPSREKQQQQQHYDPQQQPPAARNSRPQRRRRRGKREKREGRTLVYDDKKKHQGGSISSSRRRQHHSSARQRRAAASCTASSSSSSSSSFQKHKNDRPSGGVESLLPSLIGLAVLVCGCMAKMGFRGRATVAGIDLGTTNSVVCVQAPASAGHVTGEITCIPDDEQHHPTTTNNDSSSPIVPSVVSFLEPSEWPVGPSSKVPTKLSPHPSKVIVGRRAKHRIDSHPHHTLYNAKRVLGRNADDPVVSDLASEVEFDIVVNNGGRAEGEGGGVDGGDEPPPFHFRVPDTDNRILPHQVGAYVVDHLMSMTKRYLGHDNIKSAVICVPAKFTPQQRRDTVRAFGLAGVSVARILEEPTAAALAYGLDQKEGVDFILVYDFGGGTLDVSVLQVNSDGYVDVMGSDGDDVLGGADFDAAVAHFLLSQRQPQRAAEDDDDGDDDGQAVVDRVARALEHLERDYYSLAEGKKKKHQKKKSDDHDLEQELAMACPVLLDHETPLCTVSSFHTIGEQLKIALSSARGREERVHGTCLGLLREAETTEFGSLDEFCSALRPVSLSVSLEEYDAVVGGLYERAAAPVERLLLDLNLHPSEINEVVMVGGTTRMPQIRKLVRELLPQSEMNTKIDPDLTVAYGAASVID